MTRSRNSLSDEVVIMHSCFDASVDEIQEFIQPYQNKLTWGGEYALEQVRRRGNRSIWWNVSPKGPELDENNPLQSNIEILPTKKADREISEVKITCSHHPLLYIFFNKLAENLWRTFEDVDDCELTLAHTGEPKFKSLVDLLKQRDLGYKEFNEAFPEVESNDQSQTSHAAGDLKNDLPDPDKVKKYGTNGDQTRNDIRRYVARCRAFQGKGGTVKGYYDFLGSSPPFAFETLRGYLKKPKFAPSTNKDKE